ncbi:MAG: hypothetical protein HEQ35_31410 [Gloeotrichia echinulata IR180]
MQTFNLEQTITAWSSIAENVFVPHTEEEYEHLLEILDCLIDQVGEDETHPLASLMEVIGVLIENYEKLHRQALKRKAALHNCGMKSLNSTLKTLPLCAFSAFAQRLSTTRSANVENARNKIHPTNQQRQKSFSTILGNADLDY